MTKRSTPVTAVSEWISVETKLPEFDVTVQVCYLSGYDGAPIYAWGARLDDGDGWMWGTQTGNQGGIRLNETATWNGIEADDEYKVTHWMPLQEPPQ